MGRIAQDRYCRRDRAPAAHRPRCRLDRGRSTAGSPSWGHHDWPGCRRGVRPPVAGRLDPPLTVTRWGAEKLSPSELPRDREDDLAEVGALISRRRVRQRPLAGEHRRRRQLDRVIRISGQTFSTRRRQIAAFCSIRAKAWQLAVTMPRRCIRDDTSSVPLPPPSHADDRHHAVGGQQLNMITPGCSAPMLFVIMLIPLAVTLRTFPANPR